jgi:hypothetical protein
VVPEVGGHTLWADLQAAYDDLSEPVKELLESVSGVYSADPGAERGQPGQRRGVDVDRDHAVPALGVQLDRGASDPGRRAGDQHYLIAHVHSVEDLLAAVPPSWR